MINVLVSFVYKGNVFVYVFSRLSASNKGNRYRFGRCRLQALSYYIVRQQVFIKRFFVANTYLTITGQAPVVVHTFY